MANMANINRESETFYINSRNRLPGGTDSDFKYQIQFKSGANYNKCLVMAASIPISYYLINDNNNSFTLVELGVSAPVTLTNGNYTVTTYKSEVQSKLTAASTSMGHNWVYTVTYPNSFSSVSTGKLTFTVSANTGQPSFITQETSCWEQLGLNPSTTYNFSGNTLTSVNVCKFSLEDTLFLRSDLIKANANSNVLQEIYATSTPAGSTITYQSTSERYKKDINEINGNVFHFYLTNEDGLIMDLNGLNMNFTICFFNE